MGQAKRNKDLKVKPAWMIRQMKYFRFDYLMRLISNYGVVEIAKFAHNRKLIDLKRLK